MTRKITSGKVFAGMLGLALLSGVFAAGVEDFQSARLALAGSTNPWGMDSCQRGYSFDAVAGVDREELVCWTNDFTLNVPEPVAR
ncbi:MAG TPA: hypothetical protein VK066_09275 [Chloroflexota bacterium]|nr:hypothetical protein [Chloroflexota bacterium]